MPERAYLFFLLIFLLTGSALGQEKGLDQVRQEEAEDYYQKWLNEDVVYLISDEERAVFGSLTSAEEREQFIEQFWFRRDPDPRSAENEFKEEHYRRIAYANEKFASGFAGWKTDRGRIYIIHGPPAEIESFPSGGMYERPLNEGGGFTSTFPFEIWRYRHLEGIGDNILLEFVDPSLSGEYRLALHSEEKDALLNIPGVGLTWAEQLGLATKADRPWFNPGGREAYPLMYYTSRDNPFYRYETFSMAKAPPPVKYADLKELISVNISYSALPFQTHLDYFQLNDEQMIVPINVQLKNNELNFKTEGDLQVARLGVYGGVTSISNRLITEFEDDLVTSFPTNQASQGLLRESMYQKILILDRKQRYKLDLVVKDLVSEKVGATRLGIVPPPFGGEALASSSVILSDSIALVDSAAKQNEMFVLGDIKIRPKLDHTFPANSRMGIYFQLYNTGLDQSSLAPSLHLNYRVLRKGEELLRIADTSGESIQFTSDRRVVIIKALDLEGLEPGLYQILVEVEDQLTGQSLGLDEPFQIMDASDNKLGLLSRPQGDAAAQQF